MKPGVKYDTNKPEYGLFPPHALNETVKVLTAGAQKYSRDNWKKVPGASRRYFDALQRHVWAWKRGEKLDEDDGLHHLAHAICCLAFLHDLEVLYNGGIKDGEDEQKQDEVVAQKCRGSECGCGSKTSRPKDEIQHATPKDALGHNRKAFPKSGGYSITTDPYKYTITPGEYRPGYATTTHLTTPMTNLQYQYGTTWGTAIPSGWDLFFTKKEPE
jgi:hypothetical protein